MCQWQPTPPKDRFTATNFDDYKADQAKVLPLFRCLAAARPAGASGEGHFRPIVYAATQHRGQGLSWPELLAAGYAAAADHLARYANRPEEAGRFLAWQVRQGMLRNVR